jgi:hypothetical protein
MKRTILTHALLGMILTTPVQAAADPGHRNEVHEQARRLEREALRAFRRAEARLHRRSSAEEAALRALSELSYEARHFRQQVTHGRYSPRHTGDDFEALAVAFERAARWTDRLRNASLLRHDFGRVARAFDRLAYAFNGPAYRSGRLNRGRVVIRRDGRPDFRRGRPRVRVSLPLPNGRISVDWK